VRELAAAGGSRGFRAEPDASHGAAVWATLASFRHVSFAPFPVKRPPQTGSRKPLCGRALAAKNPKWVRFEFSHWMEHSGTFGQLA